MNPQEFMGKAESSLGAARLLLTNGYRDDACSRAYYAMFDAARAALLLAHAPVEVELAHTHRGLIAAFALHVVKSGKIAPDIGRLLGQVQQLRLIADYKGEAVNADDAAQAVAWATVFLDAIRRVISL